jgi:carbonic anhydrase
MSTRWDMLLKLLKDGLSTQTTLHLTILTGITTITFNGSRGVLSTNAFHTCNSRLIDGYVFVFSYHIVPKGK